MRLWVSLPLVVWLVCVCGGRAQTCTAVIGERFELNVSVSSPVSLCFPLNSTLQNEAIRVLVSSENATGRHPLLVTVRQPMGVASWTIPHVESGLLYSSVERTLCPLLNKDDESAVILIDLSTSQHTPLPVSMTTFLMQPFKVTMNSSVTVLASPSGPSYLMYEAPSTGTRVRVRFQSSENTSDICAIASIQNTYCPVVELLDNPDHRGRYQTMRSMAAINTRVTEFFYMVVTVFPTNGREGGCVYNEGDLESRSRDNFSPAPSSAEDRIKVVTITVEPTLSSSGFVVAIIVPIIVYISFYVVAIVWILVFDWWRYDTHFIVKAIKEFLKTQNEGKGASTPDSEDPVEGKPPPTTQDHSSDEEEENYEAPPTQTAVAMDTTDFSLKHPPTAPRAGNHHGNTGKLVKRPSVLSVFLGTHLNSAIDEVTPSPSQNHSHFPDRSRHNSESHQSISPAALTPRGGAPMYMSLNPTRNMAPLRFKRQKSVSDSFASPTTHSLTASAGRHMISPVESYDHHIFASVNKSRDNSLRGRKPTLRSHDSTDNGAAVISMDTKEEESPAVTGESIRRQSSYTEAVEAVEAGKVAEKKYYDFPVSVNMAEVGDIDDSPFVQKKYNRFAIYLLIIIAFYSIPAYQLVITYQRLLTTTGNEDICYYNSRCAHVWDIAPGLSLSALNNILSNIGFFILGCLYILIAYRRRQMYRSIERFNCSRECNERVGIPQHFGIYYAIGLALMAEALMSVAYHICPSNTNYQFDTTFMYILAMLGLHKLLENRCPDLEAGLHKIMFTFAVIIVVVVVGVLYSYSPAFWAIFTVLYLLVSFAFSMEVYYRWQVKGRSLKDLFIMYRREGLCPPRHIPKFIMAIITIVFNWAFGVCLVAIRPIDFGTYFLFILLSNFILYLFYYAITKMCYRETPSIRPIIFFILAVIFWGAAIAFYTSTVTDWTVSPAMSRDFNADCDLLGFYDSHDLWHFLSSFALFFFFLMIMTLDDRQENELRTKLRAF